MKSKRTLLTALAATATLSLTLAAAPDHPDRPWWADRRLQLCGIGSARLV